MFYLSCSVWPYIPNPLFLVTFEVPWFGPATASPDICIVCSAWLRFQTCHDCLRVITPFFQDCSRYSEKRHLACQRRIWKLCPNFLNPSAVMTYFLGLIFFFLHQSIQNHPKQYITNWPEQRNTNTYMTVICLSNPSFLELYINESIGTSAASSFSLLSVHLVFWLPNFSFPAIFLKPSVYFLDYNQNKIW